MKGFPRALALRSFLALLAFLGALCTKGGSLPALAAQQSSPAGVDAHDTPVPPPPPEQPIPYSHKTHLALGLTCEGCHTNPDHGRMMTFPPTSRCMACHSKIARNRPAIQKLAAFDKAGTPVPWVRVYQVLPGIVWSHRTHLDAGMKCQMCHGQVSELERMTEIKSVTTMVGCLDCHKAHNAKTTCQTCHPAWKPGMEVAK